MISPERLRKQPHCAGAPDDLLRKVAMLTAERPFGKGEVLFEEGGRATHLLFLEAGEVNIVFTLGSGNEVTVDSLVAGDVLAWSALLEPHVLTARGVGRSAGMCLAVEAEGLRKLCAEHPAYGYIMMTQVAKTLRDRLTATRVQLAAAH
jgi:CRP/FNR family transcriptional regulator, cyclic AMP receptor protein